MANESNIKDELKGLFKEHDYDQLYYKQDIVTYQINGTTNFYQAIRNVPRFVPITDRRYWNQLNVSEGSSEGNTPIDDADDVDYLCFTAQNDGANLCLAGMVVGVNIDDVFSLEYSTDKVNWETLEFNVMNEGDSVTTIASSPIEFEEGDKVYFRGDNINGTTFIDLNSQTGYMLSFVSTTETPSYFAVSGDLQTIVDKTGRDKEHGVFGGVQGEGSLFSRTSSLYITTAPDLTATSLLPQKYTKLFYDQTALTKPANMPSFTTSDLPNQGAIPVGCFENMYDGCTSLEEPANFNGLTVTSQEDGRLIDLNLKNIYQDTTFNITDDRGKTLNGFDNIVFPIVIGVYTVSSFTFASTLKNTNGFGSYYAFSTGRDETKYDITTDCEYEYLLDIKQQGKMYRIFGTDSTSTVAITCSTKPGYYINKIMESKGSTSRYIYTADNNASISEYSTTITLDAINTSETLDHNIHVIVKEVIL